MLHSDMIAPVFVIELKKHELTCDFSSSRFRAIFSDAVKTRT